MNILVYGAGAVGIYLGTMLQHSGHHVSLVGKRKLFSLGKSIHINNKKYSLPPKYTRISKTRYDVIFLTTKLYDSQKALQEIKKLKYSILCVVQNGLVEPSFYGTLLDDPRLITVSVFQGYNLVGENIITSKSKQGWVITHSKQGKMVQEMLSNAKINAHTSNKIDQLRAEKMILNCSVNALSAIYDLPIGEIMYNQKTRELSKALFDESYAVLSRIYPLEKKDILFERAVKTIRSVGHHYREKDWQDGIYFETRMKVLVYVQNSQKDWKLRCLFLKMMLF